MANEILLSQAMNDQIKHLASICIILFLRDWRFLYSAQRLYLIYI